MGTEELKTRAESYARTCWDGRVTDFFPPFGEFTVTGEDWRDIKCFGKVCEDGQILLWDKVTREWEAVPGWGRVFGGC